MAQNMQRTQQAQRKPDYQVCKLTSAGDIILPVCRLQYPSLENPTPYQGQGPEKFRATFIFPESADLSILEDEIAQFMADHKIRKQTHAVIRDDKDNEAAGFFIGARYVNATSNRRPLLIDLNRAPADLSYFYPGAIVRPSINIYANKNGPLRANAGLQVIQFLRDGDQLSSGGGSADSTEFDDLDPDSIEI